METTTVKCHCCGKEFEPTELTPTFDGEYFCDEQCFDNEVMKCDKCGKLIWIEDSYKCDDDRICEECVDEYTFICDHCEERMYNADRVSDGRIDICQDCYDDNYYRCCECESLIHSDDTRWDDDDEPYCEECYDDLGESGYILNYGYKPTPIMYYVGDDFDRFFGVELEVDKGGNNDANAEKLLEIANESKTHIYIKSDGSLNDGFEIVSHPMTLKYHATEMPWEDVMGKAVDMGYRSHQTETCGLHIHVDRESLGRTLDEQDTTIAKILYFVELHWNEIVKFTRRTQSRINQWAARYGYESDAKKLLDKAKGSYCRYTAVNLCNSKTIEFRVFRGTLKYNTFIATLQFVNRICEFARYTGENHIASTSWADFVEQITEPELIQYLKERKLYINETTTESEEI